MAVEPETPVSHNTLAWRDRLSPGLGPAWADGDLWLTLMLRKLLEKDEYCIYFINRFADLLNTTLHPIHVVAVIDALASIIEADIPLEMAGWSAEWGGSFDEWLAEVEELRDFAHLHLHYLRHYIIDAFGLIGKASLTIEPSLGKGSVRVNTIVPTSYPWHGTYFQGVPVTLEAQPTPGYRITLR